MNQRVDISRRSFLAGSLAAAGAVMGSRSVAADARARALDEKALVSITLDLEMSRNFPVWADTHWDYEKGNLNAPTKEYTVEACRRVKAAGGVVHNFLVARALEQDNVDWLTKIIKDGHKVGSHTYDHINVHAKTLDEVQFRFQSAPWLVAGKTPKQVIRENIRTANIAIKERLGIKPDGFRTPGGFVDGLKGREDLQHLVLDAGFTWVSSLYPLHPYGRAGQPPEASVYKAIVAAQEKAQPFVYPTGLVEVPMNPISDLGAFRIGRWDLQYFLKAVALGVEWAIAHRAVYDFLCHPSCLYVVDPEFKSIDLICELVRKAGSKAALVDLDTVAARALRAESQSLATEKRS